MHSSVCGHPKNNSLWLGLSSYCCIQLEACSGVPLVGAVLSIGWPVDASELCGSVSTAKPSCR